MDAGWYGEDTKPTPDEFEGDWAQHTGRLEGESVVHPNGLKDVSKSDSRRRHEVLLWLEPERVIRSTPQASSASEYFLSNDDDNSYLLNLEMKRHGITALQQFLI